jgi:hypothetical protein
MKASVSHNNESGAAAHLGRVLTRNMQDASCIVALHPHSSFFKQTVLRGEVGHDLECP